MTFKELRAGMPVYFLSGRDSDIKVSQGKVTQGAGPAHLPTPQPGQAQNYTAQPVVDVVIEHDGQRKSYEVGESLDSTYGAGMLISPNIQVILTEVGVRKSQAQERMSRRDQDEQCVERCSAIEVEWDPKARERKENDDRFRAIESSQKDMKTGFDEIKGLMNDLLKKLS